MEAFRTFFADSVYMGVLLSLTCYGIGMVIQKKVKLAIANPLIIACAMIIVILVVTETDYQVYNAGAQYISYFLPPATVCLAIPLHKQFALLKKNLAALLLGIGAGALASLASISALVWWAGLDRAAWVTLLPKSITTAIGMSLSEELGGYASITVAAIAVTGIFGHIAAETICRMFRITHPIAMGAAIGSASHVMGTSKAMELGEVQGAMSSLAIVVSAVMTVILATVVVQFV